MTPPTAMTSHERPARPDAAHLCCGLSAAWGYLSFKPAGLRRVAAFLGMLGASIAGVAPSVAAASESVVVYPEVGYKASQTFQVEINGQPVRVDQMLDMHVAYFEFSGRADVVVRVHDRISRYRVSPVSYRIPGDVEEGGREVRFSLFKARRLVVYVDNLPRLLIWGEAPEKDPPRPGQSGVIDVTEFGVPADGRHLATDGILRAIDAVPANGVLYFPPGLYLSGTIQLKSNMTLYLAAGARIIGSPLRDHYPKVRDFPEADSVNDPGRFAAKGRHLSYRQLLLIDGAENVTVRGRGIIDASGGVLRPQGFFIFILKVIDSRNVRIEDIVLNNSPAWGPHYLHSTGIVQRNTKQIANFGVRSSGGPHPDASRDVIIEDNFAACWDDFVAVKVTGNAGLAEDVENVVVRRNVVISKASALKIGTEINDGHAIRNVLFEDNDVLECDRGMSIYLEDGGLAEDIRFVNNRFERLFLEGNRRLIHFYIIEREDQLLQHGTVLKDSKGRVRNVLIKDCVALEYWPSASTIEGLDADHRISDVRIENLVIAGRPVRSVADVPLETNAFVDGLLVNGTEQQAAARIDGISR